VAPQIPCGSNSLFALHLYVHHSPTLLLLTLLLLSPPPSCPPLVSAVVPIIWASHSKDSFSEKHDKHGSLIVNMLSGEE